MDSEVDFVDNQVDFGDAHNTFFESTILKQTACHNLHVRVTNKFNFYYSGGVY